MVVLRVRHTVADFDSWKRAFDEDRLDRREHGVQSYTVQRWAADPRVVEIEYAFATAPEAESMYRHLVALWAERGDGPLGSPETWLLETVEQVDVG